MWQELNIIQGRLGPYPKIVYILDREKNTGKDLSKYYTFPIILSLDPHNTLESGLVGDYVPVSRSKNQKPAEALG